MTQPQWLLRGGYAAHRQTEVEEAAESLLIQDWMGEVSL